MTLLDETGYRCTDCLMPFKTKFLKPIEPLEAFSRIAEGRCPYCASTSIQTSMRLTLREDRALRSGQTLDERISDWINHGEVDDGSKAVVHFMVIGEVPQIRPNGGDCLRRICLLLDRIPEWQARVGEISFLEGWHDFPSAWEAFVDRNARIIGRHDVRLLDRAA